VVCQPGPHQALRAGRRRKKRVGDSWRQLQQLYMTKGEHEQGKSSAGFRPSVRDATAVVTANRPCRHDFINHARLIPHAQLLADPAPVRRGPPGQPPGQHLLLRHPLGLLPQIKPLHRRDRAHLDTATIEDTSTRSQECGRRDASHGDRDGRATRGSVKMRPVASRLGLKRLIWLRFFAGFWVWQACCGK